MLGVEDEVLGGQGCRLQLRPHRPIPDQNALGKALKEAGVHRGSLLWRAPPGKTTLVAFGPSSVDGGRCSIPAGWSRDGRTILGFEKPSCVGQRLAPGKPADSKPADGKHAG